MDIKKLWPTLLATAECYMVTFELQLYLELKTDRILFESIVTRTTQSRVNMYLQMTTPKQAALLCYNT